jgi:hypothetical protein
MNTTTKVLEITDAYNRAANWNALRYDRVYDRELSRKLAMEEILEYMTAKTPLDTLDACCDIAFVTFGMIWKLNMTEAECEAAIEAAHTANLAWYDTGLPLFDGMQVALECQSGKLHKPTELKYAMALVGLAMTGMRELGLTQAQVNEALDIVCDSNDTKTITRLASEDKGTLKGPCFIGPERGLARILEIVGESHAS